MRENRRHVTDAPQYLNGWKDVAQYLGKGVRTVQRYEREFGLPVRRPAGKSKGSVVATKIEVDAWVSASPIRNEFKLAVRPSDSSSDMRTEIKRNIGEMVRLRDHMTGLRRELRRTLHQLTESLLLLRGELKERKYPESGFPYTMVDNASRSERVLELLQLKQRGQKAS